MQIPIKWKEKLITTAQKSEYKEQKHGAILVKGREIVASGYSRMSRKLYQGIRSWTTHAEVDALLRGLDRYGNLKGDMLVVARYKSYGFTYSRPCEECRTFIKKKGIKKVLYSNRSGSFSVLKL